MKALVQGIKRFVREEEGVTMVEYGLLAALISIVCVAMIANVGTELNGLFTSIRNCVDGDAATACP